MRLCLTIAYNGAAFSGWQSQSHGNTVQDTLEKAFQEIALSRVIVHGAGRTDAGVHALAQLAHVDIVPTSPKMEDPKRWAPALNAALPPTLRILKATKVPSSFHARFSAKKKTYRYLIWNDQILPPHLDERAWLLYGPIDLSLLKKLATTITGTHDFRGFTARSGALQENTTRTLYKVAIQKKGKALYLTFVGNGFLYHMVRMLVGAMVHVARGNGSYEDFLKRLHEAKPVLIPRTAPAQGLYLLKVSYQKKPTPKEK